jgi:hypothetical protein
MICGAFLQGKLILLGAKNGFHKDEAARKRLAAFLKMQ